MKTTLETITNDRTNDRTIDRCGNTAPMWSVSTRFALVADGG